MSKIHFRSQHPTRILLAGFLSLIIVLCSGMGQSAWAGHSDHISLVRNIDTGTLGFPSPAGLAFSNTAETFFILETPPTPLPLSSDIIVINNVEQFIASINIAPSIQDPINMTFDNNANRLLIYESANTELIEILADSFGVLQPNTLTSINASQFGLQDPRGMTVDPASGHLFILDAVGPRIVRIVPDPVLGFSQVAISEINLAGLGLGDVQGIAFDPSNGNFHILSPIGQLLHEVTDVGQIVVSRDVSGLGLLDPQGMVFAQSGDLTDDPAVMNLYIADSGSGGTNGNIAEMSLTEPVSMLSTFVSTLVQTIDASAFNPPSPDTAGAAYMSSGFYSGSIFLSDSEVNEIPPPLFTGDNLFEINLSGNLLDTFSTTGFSNEPTGLAFNPFNQHLFVSDDNNDQIYELDPGPDTFYNTADDILTSIDTTAFGSFDPEGITYDTIQGFLYLVDGVNEEVYEIDPGPNGIFDGVAVDDVVTSFDVTVLGIADPEGITFDTNSHLLYVMGQESPKSVKALTTGGALVQVIDITAANPDKLAGLAFAPSSVDPLVNSLYATDRGVDNNADPNENDGKVYELTIPGPPVNVPDVVGLTQAIATTTITGAGLVLGTVTTQSSASVPVGEVISQNPVAGTSVAENSAVDIVVSSGPPVAVPNVVGLTQAIATTTITGAGLVLGTVTTQSSLTIPAGEVINQNPVAGTSVEANSAVDIVVSSGSAPTILDVQVAASSDDAEERANGSVSLTSSDLELTFDQGGNQTVGMRFNGVSVPKGATITNAYIQFQADEAHTDVTTLTIRGESSDNAFTFVKVNGNITLRPVTTASVPWVPNPWLTVGEAGPDQQTPDIKSVIQEIVNLLGWASGNSLVVLISGTGEQTAESFDGVPAAAPILHIEYVTGPPVVVPDVVGLSEAIATTTITGAGLVLGTVTNQSSATVPLGEVISQNPLAGASVAAGSAVNIIVSSGPAQVTVPNVVGLTQAIATTTITGAGLVLGTVTNQSSATVPLGDVISQNPLAGVSVVEGSAVDIVVSTGPAQVNVPNVVGLTQANATLAITGANLVLGTVTTQSSATVPAGSVISQNPLAGVSVNEGSAVNIIVSSGPPINVPNVVGLTQAIATTTITGAGLVLGTVTTQISATVPVGDVISQNPIAGTSVETNSAVDIVVSLGPVQVTVPNVVGLTQAVATTTITGAGLVLGTVTNQNSATVPAGDVISQNPIAGTSVAENSAVDIVVSLGPVQVTVPNVVGLTQAVATTTITGAGLILGTVTNQSSATVPVGEVISQNPLAGVSVNEGSAVNIVVSSGPLVVVPNVVGLTQAVATTTITGAGLSLGTVTTQSSATVPAGSVVSQNPVAGASVEANSAVDIVVSLGSTPTILEVQVAAGSDDAEERATTSVSLTSSDLEMTFDQGGDQTVGMRFNGVAIPNGATITNAYIQFQVDEVNTGVTTLTIRGENNDNPFTFIKVNGNITDRPVTTASVLWSPVPWTNKGEAGLDQQTQDIKSVIQEIVSLPLWASGNSLVVLVTGTGERTAESFDGDAAGAPILHIEFVTGPPVTVPDVVGLTEAVATTTITGANLVLGTVTNQSSATVPLGEVISQNPVAGASVAEGSAVNIVVSSGPAQVNVPNVVGLTQAIATTTITGANLALGSVTNQSSATVPAGSVISQNPLAGVSVVEGSAVDIVVSTGPAPVNVPDVVGLTQAIATTTITGAGLVLGTVTTQSSNTVPAGSVISQNPLAGASVLEGSAVDIVVSTGPPLNVPDVVGLTQAVATTTITGANLVLGTVTTQSSNTVPAGSVISQNPVAGTSVEANSAVNIVVSSGPAVNVPDVGGLTQAVATTTITGAGLVLGTVTNQISPTVLAGSVISQNPVAGTSVEANSAVDIVVSLGNVATILEVQVAAGSDDAEERATTSVSLTSSDLELTFDSGGDQTVGMRWTGLNIPIGATITKAYIQFQADETHSGATSLTIRGENNANPVTFVKVDGNITGRPVTTASKLWSPDPWTNKGEAGLAQQTPDIASIIQDIVDLPGWASGNSLVVIITGTGERTAESFDGVPSAAARLHVEYITTPDFDPPSFPTGLAGTGVSSSRIDLTWDASSDNVGVTGYDIYHCQGTGCAPNILVGSTSATSFSDINLSASTAYTYIVFAFDGSGNISQASLPVTVTTLDPGQFALFTLVGAGNIADNSGGSEATALLIDDIVLNDPNTTVFTAGDNAYENGTAAEFLALYDPTWGRHRSRTLPSPGNRDYGVPGAADYLNYFCPTGNDCVFPGNTQQLFYSYDLGNWHIISLNSVQDAGAGSAQVEWLKQDLAANSSSCILAIWHHTLFSSKDTFPQGTEFWKELELAGADVVIAAHKHGYERFAKQDINGNLDPNGIRAFVVGTGGVGVSPFNGVILDPNSEAAYGDSRGVIKFTLKENSYDWEFVPEAGFVFTDTGSGTCNN